MPPVEKSKLERSDYRRCSTKWVGYDLRGLDVLQLGLELRQDKDNEKTLDLSARKRLKKQE